MAERRATQAERRALSVVTPRTQDAAAARTRRPRAKTLAQAVAGDDYLEVLKALRLQCVAELKTVKGSQPRASLLRQVGTLTDQIEAIKKTRGPDVGEDDEDGTEREPSDDAYDADSAL